MLKNAVLRRKVCLLLAAVLLALQIVGASAAGNDWVCTGCGSTNNGNFCSNCGLKAPETAWLCPACGASNENNFCGNCGTKRPAANAEIIPDETKKAAAEVAPGYHFWFGSFEQDLFTVNGKEPIVWRVLDTDPERGLVLAMSEFGLYTSKYHRTNNKTAWGDTDVRDWLNTDFLGSFTEEERTQIIPTTVSGSEDHFFLLDPAQVSKYLRSPYLCFATPYALQYGEEGAYVNADTGASSWLVRTDSAYKRIAWVGGGGKLYTPDGKKGVNYLTTKDNVVRPVMWIRTEATGNEATEFGFPLYAKTLMKISTRSGPTTGYNGLGDYFSGGGQVVRVISRVFDGSIWWLQIEFEYKGAIVRCYTGLKRVDVNINLVPDESGKTLGQGTVVQEGTAYYGPGKAYKQQVAKYTPAVGTTGTVLKKENGWYCLEYAQEKELVRVWLPASAIQIN